MSDAAKVFTDIYARKMWGSGSGGGSTPESVPAYLALVESLLDKEAVDSVLDIGCGYGWIAQRIKWGRTQYTGLEVAMEPFAFATQIAPGPVLRRDALRDKLPNAHMAIVKEVTQHLDNYSIHTLIDKLRKFRLVLHTSVHQEPINGDIPMGETRGVNLIFPPFNLPCANVLTYSIGESRYLCQLWRP